MTTDGIETVLIFLPLVLTVSIQLSSVSRNNVNMREILNDNSYSPLKFKMMNRFSLLHLLNSSFLGIGIYLIPIMNPENRVTFVTILLLMLFLMFLPILEVDKYGEIMKNRKLPLSLLLNLFFTIMFTMAVLGSQYSIYLLTNIFVQYNIPNTTIFWSVFEFIYDYKLPIPMSLLSIGLFFQFLSIELENLQEKYNQTQQSNHAS